jgi:hypothetical protein
LFGVDDRGGYWDFRSADNLFQLSTGSTAVTAPNDPIGYVSDGGPLGRNATQATAGARPYWSGVPRTLGAETVTNGRFTADTDWTKGTDWTIGSGVATKTAGTAAVLSQPISLSAGQSYLLTYNMTRSAGSLTPQFTGGTTVSGIARSLSGSFIEVISAVTGNTTLEFSADAAFAGTLDNVTLKPVATWTNRGAFFDGTDDRLRTASIDFSNSDKKTVVIACRQSQATAARVPIETGNYLSSTAGSADILFNSSPAGRLRGDSNSAIVTTPTGFAHPPNNFMDHVLLTEFDLAGATINEEIEVTTAGVIPTQTPSGTTAGGGNMVNGTVTLGSPFNSSQWWRDLIYRAFVINRVLTSQEKADILGWAKRGMAYCAVLGDSTVGPLSSAVLLPNAMRVSAMVGGCVTGNADVSKSGDRIADQKTLWTGIADKSALEAVFVQIGLNDVKGRVGANLATTAQVIADLQDLVDTINADKPAGCKTYICGLTPCKVWLDAATNPAAAYQAWLDVNEAIAGNGSTPITDVDRRITSHVAALNDGSGNLLAIYDYNNDGVHESNEARFIIAQAWRAALEADKLV